MPKPNENDIQGLPDADLGPIMGELEKTAQAQQQIQTPQQTQTQELDLGQFKNPKDLLKSYKEIQGWATKVSQEKKEKEQRIAELEEQLQLSQYQPPVPQQNFNMQNQFQNEPQYVTREELATSRIAEVLEEENMKDGKPDPEFRERYAFAQMIAQEYPHLARTPAGVKKLFELGDKRRVETMRRNAGKALEAIFGGPLGEEETQRLVKLVKGDKATQTQTSNLNAYMPDTSTSTITGQNQNQKPNTELKIKQSVEKGDVDGVLSAIFEDIATAE